MRATTDAPPFTLPVRPNAVPAELCERAQWVAWQWERREEKWTKVPVNARTGSRAASDDPATWTDFETARNYAATHTNIAGIGYVFSADDPYTGIDFDTCRDPETGELDVWATATLAGFDSYAEISPSGTGIKAFVQATLPAHGIRRKRPDDILGGMVEMYDRGRFFTVTGHHMSGTPATIHDAQEVVGALYTRLTSATARGDAAPSSGARKPDDKQATRDTLTDDELIALAREARNGAKFTALWMGSTTGYASHSEADIALCSLLAFYTGPDTARIDGLFRRSMLMRPKWDERRGTETYGAITVKETIDCRSEYWQPGERYADNREWQEIQSSEGNADAVVAAVPRKGKPPPQRDDLIALADDAALFHDAQGIPYATFIVGSHRETHRLTSRGFKEWLAHRYYREHGGSANTQAVQDACTALVGRARYDGPEHPVFVRLAEHEGAIYLDLCDAAWRVVAIDADGWRIVTDAPVRFRRTKGMLALPTPIDGGTLITLRRFFKLPDADWVLIVAWLIAAFRPRGPYPILGFRGEQGSAKSTRARLLRSLVDPNAAALRTMPRDERDLMIAATNAWALALDNISTLSAWISDALCRLSTGGGFATRELYADEDETILDAQRPLILNGISDFATRSDLLDRLIGIDLPRIPEHERQSEGALWLAFERERPAILGALLSAVSTAIGNLPTTCLAEMPRMADFALWVTAAAPALGFTADYFLRAYSGNRANTHEFVIEASPFAATLIAYIKTQREPWEGRARDLLTALNGQATEETRKQRGWPADATRLSSDLRRIAPNLRAIGLAVDWPKARTIRLAWREAAREEQQGTSASSALSASWDADEAGDSNGNENNATEHDSVTGAQASVIHNAGNVTDDAAGDAVSRHEANAGNGNNADDADNAEKPPSSSSRTSRPITNSDLSHIFPGHREAATDD